jgi:sensor c-di-GMP phosphodiesterase-like protein
MRRSRIIAVAVLLALIGAVVPIATALYVASRLAVKAEQDRLTLFAERAITRANLSYAEAKDTLQTVNAWGFEPCSPAHIAQLRALTMNTRSVEEIGYFKNGMLKCTSWGTTQSKIEQTPPDFTTADGIEVTVRVPAVAAGSDKTMMAMQLGKYNVLVDPMRFIDVIVDPNVRLAVASDRGNLIGDTLNAPESKLLKLLPALPSQGTRDGDLFALSRRDGWIAVAIEPHADITSGLRREQMVWIPVGLFIAAFIIGIVAWLSRRRLSLLGELALAAQNKELVVFYQPIVELKTGRCTGAEALIRWRRPDGTLVRPDLFIPLAEESGFVTQITQRVIESVVCDLGKLLVADRSLHIAINLCAAEMSSGRTLSALENTISHTGIYAHQIWLEITERGFLHIETARTTIAKAHAAGYPVVIDDFGTGYSSLQYLQGLPVDALKIDKSFIDTIGTEAATSSVTSHIIDMAKTLKLKIIAEGIERESQLEYLLDHGVEFGQGWLFAKALPADEFLIFCSERNHRNSPNAEGAIREAIG